MSRDPDILTVRTLAGLTLRLHHHHRAELTDNVTASLELPRTRAERAANHLFGQKVAFLGGGKRHRDVNLELRNERWGSLPASLWIGSANIEIDDDAANAVQAWLDSRTPYAAADTSPIPDALRTNIATRVTSETLA